MIHRGTSVTTGVPLDRDGAGDPGSPGGVSCRVVTCGVGWDGGRCVSRKHVGSGWGKEGPCPVDRSSRRGLGGGRSGDGTHGPHTRGGGRDRPGLPVGRPPGGKEGGSSGSLIRRAGRGGGRGGREPGRSEGRNRKEDRGPPEGRRSG